MRKSTLFTFASFFFASCSSTLMMVEESYKDSRIVDGTMAVVVPNDDVKIEYSGDVEPEFGPGNQDSLIYDYFKKAIVDKMKMETVISKVEFQDYREPKTYMPLVKEIKVPRGDVYAVETLPPGTVIRLENESIRYVLVFDKLKIWTRFDISYQPREESTSIIVVANRMFEESSFAEMPKGSCYQPSFPGKDSFNPPAFPTAPVFPMYHSSPSKKLVCEADVMIWDNAQKKLVAYGHVRTEVSSVMVPVITIKTWESLVDKFVESIFEKTPFSSRRY